MEADKENTRRIKTRIPIPKDPLPALPKSLLEKKSICESRRPLQTLKQSESIPSSSHQNVRQTPLRVNNNDAKHVTVRCNSEDLDWDFKVFNDLNESINSTPSVKSLEPGGVRNIKRSLKRPSSRELQGLSPIVARKLEEKVKRRLLFSDRLEGTLQSPDSSNRSYTLKIVQDYSADMFEYLINVERKPLDVPRTSSSTRACVINWLIKVNRPHGNPATIQSACWYLDSVLGTGYVPLDKLQLVAAGCYWIAQKLNGNVMKASRLVKCSNKAFTTANLWAAEKAVLSRLKFPSQPVVPQEFITYFAWWCDQDHPGEIEVAATFLCLTALMVDKLLCTEYPSVIAAVTVRNALLLLKKLDLITKLTSCPVYNAALKKTSTFPSLNVIVRRAVCTVAHPIYEYKAPIEHYDLPPNYIAKKIINAATKLEKCDKLNQYVLT